MAGVIAENCTPFGYNDWVVPAYLFRFHVVELQHLEYMYETGEEATPRPGRTGDDCLAFRLDNTGSIIGCLACQAKCTLTHRTDLISDAHVESSVSPFKPVDLLRLIEVVEDSDNVNIRRWATSLRVLFFAAAPNCERCDQVTYVCGQLPVKKATWIGRDKPHKEYTAARRLHVAEVHIEGIEQLIRTIYAKD